MASIGSASLQIIPSFDGLQGHLDRGTSGPLSRAGAAGGLRFGDAAGKSAGSRFGSLFSTAAKASLVGALGAGALAFRIGKDSVEAASSLAESVNAVNVAYGKQGQYVLALANSASKLNGVSNREYNEFAVRFSAFSQTIAGSKGFESVRVLDEIGDRATDFASVFNTDVDEALTLFQSGLAGETEPLRRYGIDLSAAAVEAYALAEGIVKSKDKLTESAKVQARYQLLMEQTSKVQGDFANTSDSLANRQRILAASWEDAKAKLGTALLPVMEDFTGLLLEKGIPAVERFAEWFSEDGMQGIKTFAGGVKDAAGVVKDLVGFLNDLPSEAKLAALGAVAGGGAFLKLRGGRGGLLGSAGSALGLSKPVPVFVTNQGFGAGVAGGGKPTGAAGRLLLNASKVILPAAALYVLGEAADDLLGQDIDRDPKTNRARTGGAEDYGYGDFNNTSVVKDRAAKYESIMGGLVASAAQNVQAVISAYDTLPKKLVTELTTEGVPESMRQAKNLAAQYDLTPKEKRTLFELLGYEQTMSRARQIDAALNEAARDRRATVTVEMHRQGYQTYGGLQEGGDTFASQRNFEKATGRMGG